MSFSELALKKNAQTVCVCVSVCLLSSQPRCVIHAASKTVTEPIQLMIIQHFWTKTDLLVINVGGKENLLLNYFE